jgi:hypothetical protein
MQPIDNRATLPPPAAPRFRMPPQVIVPGGSGSRGQASCSTAAAAFLHAAAVVGPAALAAVAIIAVLLVLSSCLTNPVVSDIGSSLVRC